MSNILDKPLESVFGWITVLPGAFSAYRYIALQNDAVGQGPLQKYFLGEQMHGAGADIFTANMYLAEDRVSLGPLDLLRYKYSPTNRRFCAGSSFRSATARGFSTTSSPLTPSPTCPTKCQSSFHSVVDG
jgi:hypothetical protein